MKDALNWFEIPVTDFDRAKKFYETVMGYEMQDMPMPEMQMAGFQCDWQNGVGGAIVKSEWSIPSEHGTVVYLNGGDDLSVPLSRVDEAGGKVVFPKTLINEEVGYMAFFMDTEGNRVAFHSKG